MIIKVIKFLVFVIILLLVIIAYLSFFGINTLRFNDKIKSEIFNINKKIDIELKSVKILLDPINFSINVKTLEPKIFINEKEIKLELIKTNILIKSLISEQFTLNNLRVSIKKVKIKNLVLLTRSLKSTTELFILDNIIKDGFLSGDVNLNFDSNGEIKNDYQINGFIEEVKLNILNKHTIEKLNFNFDIKDKKYTLKNLSTNYNGFKLSSPFINIKDKNNKFSINGRLTNSTKSIVELNNTFVEFIKNNKIEAINFSSDNNFSFEINKKFQISNFNLKSTIKLNQLIYKNDLLDLNNYLPKFKDSIELKNHQILIKYEKNNIDISGKGKVIIEGKIDSLNYKINKKDDLYVFDTTVIVKENSLLFDAIEYEKKEDLKSTLRLKGKYKKDKIIEFVSILFNENKNFFLIDNLKLNDKFKILSVKKVELNFLNTNNIQNKINLKTNKKKYEIYGESFDASKLINKVLDGGSDKKTKSIFHNLNSDIIIQINKTYLDEVEFVKNLTGNIKFSNNKIKQLNLKSFFLNKKKLTLNLNVNKNNEQITTLYSEYPKPLVDKYKFINGFEEGVLDFYSIKKDNISKSVLTIDNFKLQEVPVLAKLLTLASLQGIADILTGEGIRFSDFEMKFSNTRGLMTIEELYAIGPAISILMDGYIESKKTISLRGTLVPATTINRTIASIPLIGKILVGKKTGEGVFGVSFKVKGSPKNLKTSVNPIKTLTPRFITRTLENFKKN